MSFEAALKVGSDAIEDCADSPPCAHRRAHRPVRPSKIDGDPELRAFILARIDRITFIDLAEAIRASFPPGRRVQKTALNDWWRKHLSDRTGGGCINAADG